MDQGVYSNLNEVSLAKPMPYRTEARARLFLYLFMAGTLVLWAILLIVVLAKASEASTGLKRLQEAQTRLNMNDSLAKNKLQTLEDQLSDLKSQTSCTPCSPSWKAFEGSCYYMSRTTALWHDAVKKCAEKEAHLVIINSREEQNFLISNSDDRTYWIGLSSVRDGSGKVKHHRWIDETDLTFTYWSPGEPNDAGDQEDCVVMLSNGRWNDTPCHTDLEKWVCEKRQSC
ncbi:C-type lectin domain family 4 member G-like isoform X3 [Ornithorhynchus anatinus]|uniref:C-type lectin domain family 4 member G-like isoform X3 n=1 Tax=Ornithorhynchus anatinus TaxID=9258 RepID=UPI0010A7A3A4|nr:C-type lectin domain family 4 member G-like isoform X3 [Ornithorhynchus anatinus]